MHGFSFVEQISSVPQPLTRCLGSCSIWVENDARNRKPSSFLKKKKKVWFWTSFILFKCFKWWLPSFISLWFSRCYETSRVVLITFNRKALCSVLVVVVSLGLFNHRGTTYFIFPSISEATGRMWTFCPCVFMWVLGWERKIRRGNIVQNSILSDLTWECISPVILKRLWEETTKLCFHKTVENRQAWLRERGVPVLTEEMSVIKL